MFELNSILNSIHNKIIVLAILIVILREVIIIYQ